MFYSSVKFRLKHALKLPFQHIFAKWLAKRIPANNQQQLTSKNIFIFPSLFGFAFLAFILLLFLLGTNYQNNIVLLLCYLLVSFFITAMLHSFFNLSGIRLQADSHVTGFAEQNLHLALTITTGKPRFNYQLAVKKQNTVVYNVIEAGKIKLTIPYCQPKQGVYSVERVKISSYYGFGLFVTWTHLDLAYQAVIYPKPLPFDNLKALAVMPQNSAVNNSGYQNQMTLRGNDDFFELRAYQKGESYNHVAWKQLAKGQGWLTKTYGEQQNQQRQLQLLQMPATTLEQKCQQLCFLILEYHQLGDEFSVQIFDNLIPLGHGEQHLEQCLTALAKVKLPQYEVA